MQPEDPLLVIEYGPARAALRVDRVLGDEPLGSDVGQVERLDVGALDLVPLKLEARGVWDPAQEYWGDVGEPIDDWAKPIITRG